MTSDIKEKNPCLCPTQTTVFSSCSELLNCSPSGVSAPSDRFNYIELSPDCQADIFTTAIQKHKVEGKKDFNLVLFEAYKRLGDFKKADRVRDCGSWLEFKRFESVKDSGIFDGDIKLHNANFCRDRLCPLCSWRKSLKIYIQVSRLVDLLQSDYRFLFLTLTVRNCSADELRSTIDRELKAFSKLMRNSRVKKAVKGYFRALEITMNKNVGDVWYGSFHPHLHIILAVNPSYFKSRDYIKHSEWLELWRSCYGDETIQNVNIQVCKSKKTDNPKYEKKLSSAIAEAAKYTVKDNDYLTGSWSEILDAVNTFNLALKGRRLTQFGGCFYNAFETLGLSDVEDENTDLINIEGDSINPELAYIIVRYEWGAGSYHFTHAKKPVNIDIEFSED